MNLFKKASPKDERIKQIQNDLKNDEYLVWYSKLNLFKSGDME